MTAPDVPSVLLELGYLSNEKDAFALNSPEWREKASTQVADAIESFFAARGPVTGAPGDAAALAKTAAQNPTLVSAIKPMNLPQVAGASH